jgi:hypothetical protein
MPDVNREEQAPESLTTEGGLVNPYIATTRGNIDLIRHITETSPIVPNGLAFNQEMITCDDCGDNVPRDDSYAVIGDRFICSNCFHDSYRCCDRCSIAYEPEDVDQDLCEDCLDRVSRQVRMNREDLSCKVHQSLTTGKRIKSLRRFGVEIELLAKDQLSAANISKTLPEGFGLGGDGSVKGNGYPLEITTPILQGARGENAIIAATRIIRPLATVNRTCGLHIHLESTDLNWQDIKKIFAFYMIFDEVIMSMLPRARRNNRFAKQLKSGYSLDKVFEVSSKSQLESIWYSETDGEIIGARKEARYVDSRYYGVNLHSLMRNGGNTIEIRYHSPTFSATKILNWTALHQQIIDRVPHLSEKTLKSHASLLFFEDKLDGFCSLLKLDETLEDYVRDRIALFNPKRKALCAA